jgi:DNA-binding HxlR family transcriptional regulator
MAAVWDIRNVRNLERDLMEAMTMVKRMSVGSAPCPVAAALDVIGDWWSLLIIRDAFDDVRRFSEFEVSPGIAKGILSPRLRDLTERGILETRPASEGAPIGECADRERPRPVPRHRGTPAMGRGPSLRSG